MNRIILLMQQPSHLIVAEVDPSHFRQVGSKSSCRPSREPIAEVQRVRSNGFLYGSQNFRRRSAGSPWRFDWPQRVDPPCAVQVSHTRHGDWVEWEATGVPGSAKAKMRPGLSPATMASGDYAEPKSAKRIARLGAGGGC